MGMGYENEAIGNVKGEPINFGTPEKRIIVNVPSGIFLQLGIMVEKSKSETRAVVEESESHLISFQRFFELAVWLEQAIVRYPDYFTDNILREVLTAHIQYDNNAIEKSMLFMIERSETFRDAMKVVFKRVDYWIIKNKELVLLLDGKE
jgi:hypothetical protein